MSYKVTFSSGNNYLVKQSLPSNYKVSTNYNITVMPQNLKDLSDVDITIENDKYVLMYDGLSGKWKSVNPDDVLSAAVTDPISPGLPANFENQLDVDLDNRIDLDAGTF